MEIHEYTPPLPHPPSPSLSCSALFPATPFTLCCIISPQGSVWADHTIAQFPCLDASTGGVKEVLLPRLLVETAIALLSFHTAGASPALELQVCLFFLCIRSFPEERLGGGNVTVRNI